MVLSNIAVREVSLHVPTDMLLREKVMSCNTDG